MATQSLVEFEKGLARGEVPPIVLFLGDEARLADRGLARLREAVVPEARRAFNEDRLRADEIDVPRLLDSLRTLPALGGRRLVVLRDAHRLEEKGRADTLLAALAEYAQRPSEATVLAIAAERADRRLKAWKAVERAGVVVDVGAPDEGTLPRRLEEAAEAAGASFEEGAARLLVELAGGDLGVLEGEVEKLAAFAGAGGCIRAEHVHEMLDARHPGEPSVFAWVDAVAERRAEPAIIGLGRLLAAGEEPLRLLALLARQVRLVWAAKALQARGAGVREVGEQVVPRARFLAGKLLDQARGFSEAELAAAHDALVEADLALKSSPASERFVLERLVAELCGPTRLRRPRVWPS